MNSEVRYPQNPILMVDDEPAWLQSMALSLKISAGINNVIRCSDSRKVEELLQQHNCCLILLDLKMPYIGGETLLAQIKAAYPDIAVVMISGINQIDTAIRCIKNGADDFYIKTDERERVLSGIQRLLKQHELRRENRELATRLLQQADTDHPAFAPFSTCSPRMRGIFSYLQAIAEGHEPVLIMGESGTGKELIARALHQLRAPQKPWIAVNVAGLDDMVFSDTLFGHVRGAYTGAEQTRKGMIEEAADGILFLDEIGDLAPASQVKLLRLLQEGEYYPLGSDQPQRVKARVIFATNQNLKDKIEQGAFRKDLYYRLCSHLVELPSLRQRREDLPLLIDALLAEAAESFERDKPLVPPELIELLSSYHFPGNVRELRAMIHDAVSLHAGEILSLDRFKETLATATGEHKQDDNHLSLPQLAANAGIAFGPQLPTLKQANQALIDEALQRANGNQSNAARMLGISPQALNKRLKDL